MRVNGVVTRADWANPYVYFFVRRGWKLDSLKAGDQITVDAYPAKDGSKFVDARLVKVPDERRVG